MDNQQSTVEELLDEARALGVENKEKNEELDELRERSHKASRELGYAVRRLEEVTPSPRIARRR